MRAIWALGIAFVAGLSAQAEPGVVMVTLSHQVLATQPVLVQAKAVASAIFAGIGVNLRWSGAGSMRIDVRLETSNGPEDRPGSLAYAVLGAEGSRIHIFFDRVSSMGSRASAGTMLGHVLAHEIGHVLEGVPRHSESGVLKAHWEAEDLREMSTRSLRFALVDEALIHAGLAASD